MTFADISPGGAEGGALCIRGVFTDANEMDDSRTFNTANELTARDTDTNGTANHSPTYDAVGNMTDDGKAYKLEYDAFGRMRFIKDRVTNAVIEEFRYSGLNHRIGWRYDSTGDAVIDSSDAWYYFVYDRQWRMVATVRNGDEYAKEMFVNHQAGANGMQTGLPLDAVVLRDRHTSTWSADASGSSFGRGYYCQNYFGGRGDVVAILANDGKLSQQVRYSAYGVPTGIPAGDTNADGSIVGTPDITMMNSWIGTGEVRGDLDLDGDCDSDDMNVLTSNFALGLGWNKLSVHPDSSLSGVKGGHRKGYCGYEHDLLNPSVMNVRHRVYFAELGRWTRRDPLGYVDGGNLYQYVRGRPGTMIDADGRSGWLPNNPLVPPSGASPADLFGDTPQVCYAGSPCGGLFDDDGGDGDPVSPHDCGADTFPFGDCCERAKQSGCDQGDLGGVVCCGGRLHACVWGLPYDGTIGSLIQRMCIREHEEDHFEESNCNGPGCFPGRMCRPPLLPGFDLNQEECKAYNKELQCLRRNKVACGGQQDCIDSIDRTIRQACALARDYCPEGGEGCPRFPGIGIDGPAIDLAIRVSSVQQWH